MKKLVLGALLAVASSATGCSTDNSSIVDVSWTFRHLATDAARSCPTDYPTATIISQRTDDSTHLGFGETFIDKFNCSDGAGTIVLPDQDSYLVWVEIENDSGSAEYAKSNSTYVDTSLSYSPVEVEFLDDGGYFFFEWDLYDGNTLVSCSEAGATTVEAISTSVTSSSNSADDKYDCADHYGTTAGLLEGTYTVSIDATNSADQVVGVAPTLINKDIEAPNGLTDLGLVEIPLD